MTIQEGREVEISEDLSILFGCTVATLIGVLFVYRYKEWSLFFIDLTKLERFGQPPDLNSVIQRLHLLSILYSSYCVCGSAAYGVVAKYEVKQFCVERNLQKGLHEICGTYVPIWLPVDEIGVVTENVIFLLQWMFFESTDILSTHIREVNRCFEAAFDNKEGITKNLYYCINYHNHILKLAQRLNELIKYTAGYMSCSAICLAFIANHLLTTISVANAVYSSKWYETDSKTMRDVQIIMMRCQKPIYFEAVPFGSFNYALFLAMVVVGHFESDLTEDISVALGATGTAVHCILFTLQYQKWSGFFKNLTDTTLYGAPSKFTTIVKNQNRYGKILCFYCAPWITIVYGVMAWFNTRNCNDTQICPVNLPIWLPFGANNLVVGAVVFAMQFFFVGVLVAPVFLTQCFIMYESTEMLICHINHLKDLFKGTFADELETRDKLRFCVYYHSHILNLGCRLSYLIKRTNGHMSLLAAIVCGCVANQILNTKPISAFMFLATWMFALFAFCHAGQRIKDETLSVGDALWDSKWFNADARTMRDVHIILMRCQKPIYYEALPLGIIDYPFYYMIIKTGYTYFTLLNQSM
ncbi:hypothetical protein NQ315_005562 [Exocentrus adspersus]|uniref:Odorant receptor n=1 Tax=Exocentrus adspersus TaxID=1586481 RepID=A0AAV8VTA9_9CUCU|nr:hypothetical protein NQ315_005562 [Exocentrus adspersus]